MTTDSGPGLLAVNLYRQQGQAAFSDGVIDAVRGLTRPLLACMPKHLVLARAAGGSNRAYAALQALTGRELEVCQRLLKGWTHDGIAADLGLSAGTVKTYRDRAFDKLGIHCRNELFALVINDRPAPPGG